MSNITVLESPLIDSGDNVELPENLFVSLTLSTCCSSCVLTSVYLLAYVYLKKTLVYVLLEWIQCKNIFRKHV